MRHLRVTLAVCFPYDNSPQRAFTAGAAGCQPLESGEPGCSAMHSNRLSMARGLVRFKFA